MKLLPHRVTSPASHQLPLSKERLERLLKEISRRNHSLELLEDPYRVRVVQCIDHRDFKGETLDHHLRRVSLLPGDSVEVTARIASFPVELADPCSDVEILNAVVFVMMCMACHEVQEGLYFRGVDVVNPHHVGELFQDVCFERRSIEGNHLRSVFEAAQQTGLVTEELLATTLTMSTPAP